MFAPDAPHIGAKMSVKVKVKRPAPPRRRPVKGAAAQVEPSPMVLAANKRFIFKGDVLERVGVSYPCLWRWMRDGKFPVALEVGGRCAWLESDIDEWMQSRPLRQYKKREVA